MQDLTKQVTESISNCLNFSILMLTRYMVKDYENWTGSRPELISLIKLLEKENPKLYKFFSKQLGKYSSVNDRRINNLSTKVFYHQFLKIRNIFIIMNTLSIPRLSFEGIKDIL